MKDMVFKVTEGGITHEYFIVDFFKNEENKKDYVVYDEKDDEDLYASAYEIVNNEIYLLPILSDEEWDYVDYMLEDANV